ncbi:RING finger protein 222 [Gracilinanus agilis]|uniref:RING finger protein 222 n=1 Tax=Gracilinanus agilis TaxID=191870 RepID=UPI001CFC82ED|nr:RING finger protein 222 [Gracilinanus agilis]
MRRVLLMLSVLPSCSRCLHIAGAAMSEGESKDSVGSECPVCYEKFRDLEGASRTLSCGHVFCHDCLVKYLLSCKVDGQIQKTIVCPICRYVTFLSKKSSRWPSLSSEKSPQTLTVPVGLDNLPSLDALGHTNPLTIPHPLWVPSQSQTRVPQLPRDLLPNLVREPQIFIISRHGMPLGEEDSVLPRQSLGDLSEASPAPSSSCSHCCRSRMLLLITFITVVAVIATILPWVLLVRKEA